MNKKNIALLLGLISFPILSLPVNANANNATSYGCIGRELYGSSYWTTANIREWLNSNKSTVRYTTNPPTAQLTNNNAYDNEAGFLNEFTQEEQDAIAITERLIWVQDMDSAFREAGSGTTSHANNYGSVYMSNYSHFATNYKAYGNKKEKDKVFLLTPYETYWYLNRRGFDYKRLLTPQVQSKYNTTATYTDWWLQGGTQWGDMDKPYFATTDNLINYTDAINRKGIVPAINLKPNYELANGKLASNLKIGDTIQFGRYLGATITWRVINISDNGYPLLLANNVLDLKVYDAKGDPAKQFSEYINFESADISYYNGVQYKSTSLSTDTDVPTVNILNREELNVRQNSSFTLEIEVTDPSGIEYIIKPDGTRTTETNFNYTISANGNYVLKTMDKAGNYNEYLIPVSNVNQEPFVNIVASNTNWTNQNVTVDISASNEVKYTPSTITMKNGQEHGGSLFPNYTSYVGKTFRVTGKVKLISYSDKGLNGNVKIGFSYRTRGLSPYTYTLGGAWTGVHGIPVSELIANNGEVPFDFEWTVPSNYVQNLQSWMTTGLSVNLGDALKVEVQNVKYELLDNGDFALNSITLPNGDIVTETTHRDVISQEGQNTYTYSVLDNRDKITKKSIVIKIDKTNPVANINYNKTYAKNVTLNLTSSDVLSGVKRIQLPNGNYVNSSTTNYTVEANGDYVFKIEDVAGNVLTKTVTVDNIDHTPPTMYITKNPTEWTNNAVTIIATSDDIHSGAKRIKLPDGNYVNGNEATYIAHTNGTYNFVAYDNLDNALTKDISITNIDKVSPVIDYSIEVNTDKRSGYLNINATDNQSGILKLKLPDGTVVTGGTYKYPITNNGDYPIVAYDNLMNESLLNINVSQLLNANLNPSDTERIEYKLSGATTKDWATYTGAFYIRNEGFTTITSRSYDNAGNISNEQTSVVRIDKTNPNNNSILIELR